MTLTIFSFGYCGWGSATSTLVSTFDTVEAARGYAPPFFVDARLRRAVRAEGFRERAFEALLGPQRHAWSKKLGNRSIVDGGDWVLHDDSGLDDLIDIALRVQTEGRRVVFFCSCGAPPTSCHRYQLISKALPKRARRRGIDLDVVEWPGGEPQRLDLHVDRKTARLLQAAASRAQPDAPPPTVTIADASPVHALPWCSTLIVHDVSAPGAAPVEILAGPPLASVLGWHLPVLGPAVSAAAVQQRRKRDGYAMLSTTLSTATTTTKPWASTAIYTLAHRDKVAAAGGSLTLVVRRAMTTAATLLTKARAANEALGIVVGDAVDCAEVLAVGEIARLRVTGEETEVLIDSLRVLPKPRRQQELVVVSTGKPIGVGYIRPYALVRAPRWLD